MDLAERRRAALRDQLSGERPTLDVAGVQSEIDRRIAENQLLSHVSHELRTPLTALYGYVTILANGIAGEPTDEQRAAFEAAADSRSLRSALLPM